MYFSYIFLRSFEISKKFQVIQNLHIERHILNIILILLRLGIFLDSGYPCKFLKGIKKSFQGDTSVVVLIVLCLGVNFLCVWGLMYVTYS